MDVHTYPSEAASIDISNMKSFADSIPPLGDRKKQTSLGNTLCNIREQKIIHKIKYTYLPIKIGKYLYKPCH